MQRERALELARGRLFSLRALSGETLRRRADERLVEREEAGSGSVHCRIVVIRYGWTEIDGEPAVRVSVTVEDGGWPVLDEDEVTFVRALPPRGTDPT